jgi:hypothetical protein
MVPAEFHVANQGRADRHWITSADHPWLLSIAPPITPPKERGQAATTTAPEMLRHLTSTAPEMPRHAITTAPEMPRHATTTTLEVPRHAITTAPEMPRHATTTTLEVPRHAITTAPEMPRHATTTTPEVLRQGAIPVSSDALHGNSATVVDRNSIAISPELQRRSLLRYLFELPAIPHPGRSSTWTDLQQEGLRVFRERCSSCHLPIRTTRNEGSRVPFEEWAAHLSDPNSDLIWGAPFLIKTGIEPYVSPAGARVPSLQRVRWKRPYFTNGSARSLEEVLERFRYDRVMGWHEPPEGAASHGAVQSLTSAEQTALRAVLDRF